MCKKWRQKLKNESSKCVLDLNFAPIKGSVFSIFYKETNSLYPNAQVCNAAIVIDFFPLVRD